MKIHFSFIVITIHCVVLLKYKKRMVSNNKRKTNYKKKCIQFQHFMQSAYFILPSPCDLE